MSAAAAPVLDLLKSQSEHIVMEVYVGDTLRMRHVVTTVVDATDAPEYHYVRVARLGGDSVGTLECKNGVPMKLNTTVDGGTIRAPEGPLRVVLKPFNAEHAIECGFFGRARMAW